MSRKIGALLTPVVLAAALLSLVGCGSGAKTGPLVFTTKTTTTLANPTTGQPVRCRSVHAKIPPEGESVALSGKGASSSTKLQLTRQPDGSLIISCKP
jgi:predicted small lipoprotein YifL